MAGNDSLQFARGAKSNLENSSQVPVDGQPVYDKTANRLFVGDGTTPLKTLTPLSDYDLVIDSQSKFTSYIAQNYGQEAKSVLLVNNGLNYTLTDNAILPEGTVLFESIDGATIILDGYSFDCAAATVRGIKFIVNRVPTAADVTYITNATALENVSVTLSRPSVSETPKLATIFANTPKCNNCYVQIITGKPFWNGFTLFSDCDEVTNLQIYTPPEPNFDDNFHIANNAKIVTGAFGNSIGKFTIPFVNCATVVTDDGVVATKVTGAFYDREWTKVEKDVGYTITFGKTYEIDCDNDKLIHGHQIFCIVEAQPLTGDKYYISPMSLGNIIGLGASGTLDVWSLTAVFFDVTTTTALLKVGYPNIVSGVAKPIENISFYIRELK